MYCKGCGSYYEEDAKYCHSCGRQVAAKSQEDSVITANAAKITEAEIGFSSADSEYRSAEVIRPQDSEYRSAEVIRPQDAYADSRTEDIPRESPDMDGKISPDKKTNTPKGRKKLWLALPIGLTALAAVSLLLYVLIFKEKDSIFTLASPKAIEIYHDVENKETLILNTDGEIINRINDVTRNYIYTPDYTAAIVANLDNRDYYYVNSEEILEIRSGVDAPVMSYNGSCLAYSYYDTESAVFKLCLYEIENRKEILLDQNKEETYSGVRISPDGYSVAYTRVSVMGSRFDTTTYVSRNLGKPEIIEENMVAVGISVNGDKVYCSEYKDFLPGSFYVYREGELLLISDGIEYVTYNRDCTEVIYDYDGKAYLSINGNESIKISDSTVSRLITPFSGIRNNGYMFFTDFDSFKNKVLLMSDNTLLKINKKYAVNVIDKLYETSFVKISEDGNDLLYLSKDQEMIKLTDVFGKCRREVLSEDMNYGIASGDLSQIYLSNLKGDLFYYKGKGRLEQITSEFTHSYFMAPDGKTVFYLSNKGTLYFSRNGSKPGMVENGQNVIRIENWNYGIAYYTEKGNGKYDIYYHSSGTEFKKILEDVGFIIW